MNDFTKKNKRIWIISEVFYPEETSTSYIMTKIANHLAQNNDVQVICGSPIYNKKISYSNYFYLEKSIIVHRIKGLEGNKNSVIFRIYRSLILSLKITKILFFNLKSNDKVIIVTNPPLLILFISILRIMKYFNYNVIVHDIFPENILSSDLIRKRNVIHNFIKYIFDRAYSIPDCLIPIGEDMKKVLIKKTRKYKIYQKIVVIPNWAEIDTISPSTIRKYSEKIIIQFAGNLGRVQGYRELLNIIKNVQNEKIEFVFRGEGAYKKNIIEFVRKNEIKNVYIYNSYKREEQNEVLNSCDIAAISLIDTMYGLGVPSRAYNFMAAGKPLLYIGHPESEIALLIKQHKNGFVFSFNQKNEIIMFLNNLSVFDVSQLNEMGKISRRIAENEYSEDKILNKFEKILS